MTDATLVNVFNARDKLLEDSDRSFLVQALVLYYVIEQFSIDTVFHDQVQFSFCLDYLINSKFKSILVEKMILYLPHITE